jgi:hypothetical protein
VKRTVVPYWHGWLSERIVLLLEVIHPLKICQCTFHGPTLTSVIFESTSEV